MRSLRGSGRSRVITALATIILIPILLASGAEAQSSSPNDGDLEDSIQIRTNKTAAVLAGDTAWITLSIRGQADVDDLRFTATLDGQPVAYPENTVDHSGPYNGYGLKEKETDYVAFQITAPMVDKKAHLPLELQVTWTEDGSPRSASETVKVPVVTFSGEPYELVSDEVTLSEADNGWVRIRLAGLAPQLDDVRVAVTDPTGLTIHYPQETYTSLLRDARLENGETDEANFRLGEEHWGQSFAVELKVDYTLGGEAMTRTHQVTITS